MHNNVRGFRVARNGILLFVAFLCVAAPSVLLADVVTVGGCGSGALTIRQGDGIPLPGQYGNPTGSPVTFTFNMNTNVFFGPAHAVGGLTLPAGTGENILPGPVVPTTYTMPLTTDHVVIEVTSDATGSAVLATCDYTVTLLQPFPDTITVPVRLCALEGSPQAGGKAYQRDGSNNLLPNQQTLTAPASDLVNMLQSASDKIWLPQAHIILRAAAAPSGIPVVADPSVFGISKVGSIDALSFHLSEEKDIVTECESAWQNLYGVSDGIPVTVVQKFDNSDGEEAFSSTTDVGLWVAQDWNSATGQRPGLCVQPRSLAAPDATFGWTFIVDPGTPLEAGGRAIGENPALELAHELGHTLMLGHGNGVDDNTDGLSPSNDGLSLSNPGIRRYDQYCDHLGDKANNAEDNDVGGPNCTDQSSDPNDRPGSLMWVVETKCTKLWPLQVEQARAAAKLIPGAITGAADPAGQFVGDLACTNLPCGVPDDLFTVKAEVAETPALHTTALSHTVWGVTPAVNSQYLFFADLDNNAATGCSPSDLGFNTTFAGAELVTKVTFSNGQTTPLVWRCQNGSLVPISDPAIGSHFSTHFVTADENPSAGFSKITVEMPDSLRGPAASQVRVQTLSQHLGADSQLYRLPSGSSSGGTISLIPSSGATCTVAPTGVQQGASVTVNGSGLPPGHSALVSLGADQLAVGAIDATGNTNISFSVPASADTGPRQITVLAQGTGSMAVCALKVFGPPLTPVTVATVSPLSNTVGWNNQDITIALSAFRAPGGPAISHITYTSVGAQVILSTEVSGTSASFAISTEGVSSVAFFATDITPSSELPEHLVVKLDKTNPSISSSRIPGPNANGWNNGNVTAIFSCNDTTSGIATCTSPTVISSEGADQAVTGSATDFAFNSATATVSGISIDKTLPTVTYSGNSGTYTVDQTVNITCGTADTLSGVASTTCQSITGPAYGFSLGSHTFSATAIDRADNVGTAQTSFVVQVTYASLCNLTKRFVTKQPVASALCTQLMNAQAAQAAGNLTAKAGSIGAYKNAVSAQIGKTITSLQAHILIVLAGSL